MFVGEGTALSPKEYEMLVDSPATSWAKSSPGEGLAHA